MNTLPECSITDTAPLLPHSGRMVLIDRINRYGDYFVEAVTQIRSDHILLVDDMLPYTAFIELMAQAVGAYAGIQARKNAQPVRLGFGAYVYSRRRGYGCVRLRTALDRRTENFVQNTSFRRHFGTRLIERVQPRTPCRNNLMLSEQVHTYGEQP